MGFKIKNSLTGEFEKLPILTLKGEKGETGGVEEYNKVDYMGNKYETLKQANDANVEYAVKTAIGEFNYLDYDGQHITATDTIAGQAKNAVVKGQTLVNIFPTKSATYSSSTTGQIRLFPSTKLTKPIPINGKAIFSYENIFPYDLQSGFIQLYKTNENNLPAWIGASNFIKKSNGKNYVVISNTYDSEITHIDFYVSNGVEGNYSLDNMMIIEYQEGMENWDIPYFEGMASVKAPVLKSVGKNLFNTPYFDNMDNLLNNIDAYVVYKEKTIKLKPNTTYTISHKGGELKSNVWSVFNIEATSEKKLITTVYNSNNWFNTAHKKISPTQTTFKSPSDGIIHLTCYSRYKAAGEVSDRFVEDGMFTRVLKNIQLEEGSAATPYEPYKSNTLSTPEDLELRGIGNVKDELNVATGELTQRIGEIVFSSSDGFNYLNNQDDGNFSSFAFIENYNRKPGYNGEICDRLKRITNYMVNENGIYYYGNSGKLELRLDTTNFISRDLIGLNDYLSKNPITVQYALTTESIKTVDLSDNHVYSYKDVTHYDCSSEDGSLIPTLSVKVPTDVQATIAQQRETIQTLNSENERLNQIQEALKASMLDSQVQLMNLSWNTDFEVFTLRESIAPKDSLMDSKIGSNIDKFSQAKFIIENDCPDLEKLNSQIEYYFSKDVFSQEQFEELTDLISIVKGGNGCEY